MKFREKNRLRSAIKLLISSNTQKPRRRYTDGSFCYLKGDECNFKFNALR